MTLTVNIHEARTHLSRLIERAARGESFIIAKSGRPMVKLTDLDAPRAQARRAGFMAGQCSLPPDFDRRDGEQIGKLFGEGA